MYYTDIITHGCHKVLTPENFMSDAALTALIEVMQLAEETWRSTILDGELLLMVFALD